MAKRARRDKPEPRVIELAHHSYQPGVAELNEDMRVEASFRELAKAVLRPVRISYVMARKRKPWMSGLRHLCM